MGFAAAEGTQLSVILLLKKRHQVILYFGNWVQCQQMYLPYVRDYTKIYMRDVIEIEWYMSKRKIANGLQ